MSDSPSEFVTFGTKYRYRRSTSDIIKIQDNGFERVINRAQYTRKVGNELVFSDSLLAVEMFASELQGTIIPVVRDLRPRWAAVQLALPFIELIGKVRNPAARDGPSFRAAARKLFPRSTIEPIPTRADYEAILRCLWTGLRCGLSHTGFMQELPNPGIDIQVRESEGTRPLRFRGRGDRVVEVVGKQFVDTVISGLEALIAELRGDAGMRETRFLPRWQRRWGSYSVC